MPDIYKLKRVASTTWIHTRQHKALKIINEATGIPMAALIRQGIDMVLEKHGERIKDRAIAPENFEEK